MQSIYTSQPRREAEGKLDASWVLGKSVLEKKRREKKMEKIRR
jgi:hypothetical protein